MKNGWELFEASLNEAECPESYSILLKALWMEAKGYWHNAHNLIDKLTSVDAAWVHAYLHRVEGDLPNADYWYHRAVRQRPAHGLEEERRILVEFFSNKKYENG